MRISLRPWRWGWILPALGLWCAGCATPPPPQNQDVVVSNMLREFELRERAAAGKAELPDAPMGTARDGASQGGAAAATVAAADPGWEAAREGFARPEMGRLSIQPDSILRITVEEDPGLGGTYPVNDIGAIALGYIGPVVLDNLSETEATAKIQERLLARDFKTATVTVKIMRPSYDRCTILGDVVRGGEIKLGAGDVVSLKNALMRAGGIQNAAKYTRVRVVRGGMLTPFPHSMPGETFRLSDAQGNPKVPDITLSNNDIAFVYSEVPRGVLVRNGRWLGAHLNWVLVLGEVTAPGYVSFVRGERFTMMNLVFRMGGLPPYANDRAIRVLRRNSEGFEYEYRVNVREIMKEGNPDLDFPLQSGDRIVVPSRGFRLL